MSRRRRAATWFGDRENGSAALQLAVVAPGLLLLLALIVAAGRVQTSGGAVEAAAHAAARAASLARTPAAAQSAGDAAARASLTEQQLSCTELSVRVDTTGLAAPLGKPAQVSAAVACRVALGDLLVPGLPGSVEETRTFTSAVDPYRGRAG